MAAVQGLTYNMSSSTGPVSRLTELQNLLTKSKELNITPKTHKQAFTQPESDINRNNEKYNRTQQLQNLLEKYKELNIMQTSNAQTRTKSDGRHTQNHKSHVRPLQQNTHLDQARFQQKQLQEKEQKLLALYEDQAHQGYQRFGPGGGKVRQLFQERRGPNHHSAGWDKSYPLEPITDNRRERGASLDRNLNNVWKHPVRRTRSQVRRENDELPSSRSFEPLDQLALKYNNPVFGDENDYLSRVKDLDATRIFRKLPNIGGAPLSDSTDRFKTYIATKQHHTTSMAPAKEAKPQSRVTEVGAVTKALSRMSPPSKKTEVKPAAHPIGNTRIKTSSTPPASGLKQRSTYNNNSVPGANNRAVTRPASDPPNPIPQALNTEPPKMNKGQPANRPAPTRTATGATQSRSATRGPPGIRAPVGPTSGARTDLVPCKTCNRSFAPDRIQAHSEICAKTARKKRKPFDVAKQRVKGTELEGFSRKSRSVQPPPSLAKSNWRRKHEEFINNIRAAKQAQVHVAKGGKLSDLPPPPPLDTSDYIQCPHCGRKFNEAAAERHIPKCATMLHNKPKPGPTTTRPTAGGAKPKTTKRY